ncbi:MAG: MFS transporter [Chloroflexi bacterium RBG_13_51_18]|nr:MAG: MFS transporter [Chloroflexi bacterium RBG_13_51_18]
MPDPVAVESTHRKIWGLHHNVFFLGLVSLLTDISSEMIFTLVPLFVTNVLKGTAMQVGLIGGISESFDAVFRIFSGRISDRFRRRKALAVLGYGISTIVKPFMLLVSSWGGVLGIRFGDRIGKGIRSSPRDALIADSVSADKRGKSFGIHRAMDTSGAVLGLVIAAIIIYIVQPAGFKLGEDTFRWMVIIGVVPAFLAVVTLLAFVHEKGLPAHETARAAGAMPVAKQVFSSRFKLFLFIMATFTLGNSSDFFIVLRAQDLSVNVLNITLMLVLFNVTYAIVATPAGIISDKLGRRKVIAIGWTVYALVYLGFAVSTSVWHIWVLFAAYGIYYGIVEGVAKAFVADLVPAERRGTAYGYYQGVVGLTLLPASVMAGWLWDKVSPAAPFYLGAGLAFIAMLGLFFLLKEK